ncbi:VWA domain-containing protein, partial [Streptomyces sp. NPDC001858]
KPEATPAAEAESEAEPVVAAKPEAEPEAAAAAEPEATLAAEAEPVVAAKPEAEPEAAAVAEPEAAPAAAAEPEAAPAPAAVAESEPAPEAEPEPVPAPAPAAEAEPEAGGAGGTPEAEPAAAVEDKAAPAASVPTPVAAVADGGDAPQGPPAVDDETVTGGAGGGTGAEGGAEAQEERGSVELPGGLATAYDAAAATLAKTHLTDARAKLYLVLDRSASMRPYYKDGSAQALAEQTLALAAHLDPEGPEKTKVHVTFFSTEVDGTGELTLADHENKIDDLHAGLGRMGRTSYHAAVEDVLTQHGKEAPGTPALVVFQTDGAPDAKTPATQALTDAAQAHPAVFFSFVAFGDPENKAFDYLRKLKLANTSHFLAGETPRELTDTEVYEGILANWRP